MQAVLSQKGEIVIPTKARQVLGLKAGDRLTVSVEDGGLRLTVMRAPARKVSIGEHPASGLPYAPVGRHAPALTVREIQRALANKV
jgi:AbrB family looped-hinge helix DNA binding protein